MNDNALPTTLSFKATPTLGSATESQIGSLRGERAAFSPRRIDAPVRVASEAVMGSLDLSLPLTNIGETLAEMRNGHFGVLSPKQIDLVESLLSDCDAMQTLLHQTIQPERTPAASAPNAIRQAIQRYTVQRSVTNATAAVLASRGIELLWDGADDASVSVFADGESLSRLLSGLVLRAAQSSQDGSTVLVRIEEDPDRGVVCWSVIDAGEGWTMQQLQRLSNSGSFTTSSDQESAAQWMLCRQLATWQYSRLTIRSQTGRGTEVSFETPAFTPVSIATAFARFRFNLLSPNIRPQQADALPPPPLTRSRAVAHSVRLDWTGSPPRRLDRAAIGHVELSDACSLEMADQIHRLLHVTLSPFELVYRTGRRTWAWTLDADHHMLSDRIARIESIISDRFPDPSLRWSDPAVMPIRGRAFQSLLIDRLTTGTLSGSWTDASVRGSSPDEVRLGTVPISSSPIAATRLDEELRRLSQRMRQQSNRLSVQSIRLRPEP